MATRTQRPRLLAPSELDVVIEKARVAGYGRPRDPDERKTPGTAIHEKITILDPNWLTGAIYALINSPMVRDQKGELRHDQLGELLDPARYPARWHELILSMMQEPALGLCLPIAHGGPPRYLLPDALPIGAPDYGVWPPGALRFRFQYHLLPTGFIPRFIVEAHRSLTDHPTWWRTGVVLGAEGCLILVRGDPARNRVEIQVAGKTGQRAALSIVRNYSDAVHRYYARLPVQARVPGTTTGRAPRGRSSSDTSAGSRDDRSRSPGPSRRAIG